MVGIYQKLNEQDFINLFMEDAFWKDAFSLENLKIVYNLLMEESMEEDEIVEFNCAEISRKYFQASSQLFVSEFKNKIDGVENMSLDEIKNLNGVLHIDSEDFILYLPCMYKD